MRALGSLGGDLSQAFDINEFGVVVGYSFLTDTDVPGALSHAVRYRRKEPEDLGTLGGDTSVAFAINSNGAIVGSAQDATGWSKAFVWSNGVMLNLGTVGGGRFSVARAINSAGSVVGYSEDSPDVPFTHAFLYQDGMMIDLNVFNPAASGWELLADAFAINDRGEIVGYGYRNGQLRAFKMSPVGQ